MAVSLVSGWMALPLVGMLGLIDPNFVPLGKSTVKETTIGLYVDHGYDTAVLGLAVKTQDEHRYLPLQCSVYRGFPSFDIDAYVSTNDDGLWIEIATEGGPMSPIAYFELSADGSPQLDAQDSYSLTPTPASFSGYSDQSRKREPGARKVLSASHTGE